MTTAESHPTQFYTQIDFSSLRPYYAQILDSLRDAIHAQVWRPGDLLPSEAELCASFAVSRTVVRRALQELEYEGVIYRRKGKGSFVAEPRIHERLVQRLTGFHQDMVSQGHAIANRVLRLEVTSVDSEAMAALNLSAHESVIVLERLRFVDGQPVNLSHSFVPQKRCSRLLQADLTHGSLYAFLEEQTGQRITRGSRIIEAIEPTAQLAKLLEIESHLPLFKITNTCYLADGTAIEHSRGYHRSDRAVFQVELLRDSALDPETQSVNRAQLNASQIVAT